MYILLIRDKKLISSHNIFYQYLLELIYLIKNIKISTVITDVTGDKDIGIGMMQ